MYHHFAFLGTYSILETNVIIRGSIEIPQPLESCHHEVEFAIVIGAKGRDIPEERAMDHVEGELLII